MNPYRYFSLLFSFPSAETVREVRDSAGSAGRAGLHSGKAIETASIEELQAEYTRLFISAYPKLLCPPYESYYREGVVYGNSSIEVGEWYRRQGLDFTCEGQPPDLLSAELDFLALTDDKQFLARMKEWIFEFTARVKEHSKLYGPCAAELEDLLKQEEGALLVESRDLQSPGYGRR